MNLQDWGSGGTPLGVAGGETMANPAGEVGEAGEASMRCKEIRRDQRKHVCTQLRAAKTSSLRLMSLLKDLKGVLPEFYSPIRHVEKIGPVALAER